MSTCAFVAVAGMAGTQVPPCVLVHVLLHSGGTYGSSQTVQQTAFPPFLAQAPRRLALTVAGHWDRFCGVQRRPRMPRRLLTTITSHRACTTSACAGMGQGLSLLPTAQVLPALGYNLRGCLHNAGAARTWCNSYLACRTMWWPNNARRRAGPLATMQQTGIRAARVMGGGWVAICPSVDSGPRPASLAAAALTHAYKNTKTHNRRRRMCGYLNTV